MRYTLFLFAIILLSSCEKNIDINLKNADTILVVDAQIENGKTPAVILTNSLNYFSQITPSILSLSFVHDASITISNGTVMQSLKEYTYPLGSGYFGYYYGVDTANPTTAFIGEFNKSYALHINVKGKIYDATTTIPLLSKYPDSLWVKRAPMNPDTNKRVLMMRIKDPPGLGNYTRYFTKRNDGLFLPGQNSVFDDSIIDGTTYEVQVDPGDDSNSSLGSGDNFFEKGDTVTLKLCNIDKATYTFWNTWEFARQSIGNPFSQPGKVIGNISNGALGVFSGYAAWYGTVVAH